MLQVIRAPARTRVLMMTHFAADASASARDECTKRYMGRAYVPLSRRR